MNDDKVLDVKRYYCIYDKVSMTYCDPFRAKNNADALRCFHSCLAKQQKQGIISDVDDYELYSVVRFTVDENGKLFLFPLVEKIEDNEKNNREE